MEELGSVYIAQSHSYYVYLLCNQIHIVDERGYVIEIVDAESPVGKVIQELADPKFYPCCKDCGDSDEIMFCKNCAIDRY